MLRLNNSCVTRKTEGGIDSIRMYAVFDSIDKRGMVKEHRAKRFDIEDNFLVFQNNRYALSEAIDLNADPEDLIEYFESKFNTAQPDLFLEPPTAGLGIQIPKYIKEVRWEHPIMKWRAIDKSGAVAYFEHRPVLDKAGCWVSAIDGVVARYGKSLCIPDNYQCSVEKKGE